MARNDLKGKVVLITGGAKNLGGLLSRDFAAKGAKVAIHYNSDSTKAAAEKTRDRAGRGGRLRPHSGAMRLDPGTPDRLPGVVREAQGVGVG